MIVADHFPAGYSLFKSSAGDQATAVESRIVAAKGGAGRGEMPFVVSTAKRTL